MSGELRDLIEKVCADTLRPEEGGRLDALLRASEENRRIYLDYLGLHARLAWEYGPRGSAPSRRRIVWSALAAAALLMGLLVLLLRPSGGTSGVLPADSTWNESRLQEIEIWPAATGLSIDGDLSEWPERGRFSAACLPAIGAGHGVEGRMAYDARFLYIAARVGDPLPLRNGYDPRSEAVNAWMGGGLQIRLSTDRSRPWPVQADHLEVRRQSLRALRPEDVADTLTHLTLWFYAPRGEACLHLAYGMGFDRDRVNPEGFRAVFKQDGKGYSVEYAVPWDVLGVGGNPPRAGDVLAATWTVNWSDESGRLPRGQLVEILNPARPETRWSFMRAADWGRALYR